MSRETGDTKNVEVSLDLEEAESAHAALERLLEEGNGNEKLELAYRKLGWRILAAKDGSGLTARLSEIARKAQSLEQFERERDDELGPILEGLESGDNRDP
ncbi:hypothetical protein BH24ACT16_BH24ACT16_09870 [soil metagenome]